MRPPAGRHRRRRFPRSVLAIAVVALVGAGSWLGTLAFAGSTSRPDLALSAAFRSERASVGQDLLLTVSIRNPSAQASGPTQLSVSLSSTLVPESMSNPPGGCRIASTISCDLNGVGPGATLSVDITLAPIAPGPASVRAELIGRPGDSSDPSDLSFAATTVTGSACDVVGTAGPEVLTVSSDTGAILCGLAGDDVLSGGPGDDTLIGGSGRDAASYEDAPSPIEADLTTGAATGPGVGRDGLASIEDLVGSRFDDRLAGDGWQNRIQAGSGDDTLSGAGGDDSLDGGPGRDVADFRDSPGPMEATLESHQATGDGIDTLTGLEDLVGSDFDDELIGDAQANELRGGKGDDRLSGGRGDDRLDGGKGSDTASFSTSPQAVTANLAEETAQGDGADVLVAVEALQGSRHGDHLVGSDRPDRLSGGKGNDVLSGGLGNDSLMGGAGHDTLLGGPGQDELDGGKGTDACAGGAGSTRKSTCEVRPVADALGLELFEPSPDVVGLGFHESLFETAVAMLPEGSLSRNDNPGKFTPSGTSDGLAYAVMGSRGRPAPATSSIDVAVPSRSQVRSPVTGIVVQVRAYLLYCESTDWQIVIEPAGRPDLRVMVLHVVDVPVQASDEVVAGLTVIGTSWGNDLPSAQENRYFPDQYPHVHIEVEQTPDVPIPGCNLE